MSTHYDITSEKWSAFTSPREGRVLTASITYDPSVQLAFDEQMPTQSLRSCF